MEILANIFLIALMCVIVIDVLGFIDSLNPILSKLLGFKVRIGKPFSCSTCMTWWTGLAYLIIAGKFSFVWIAVLLCIAASTPQIENLWWNIQGLIGLIINFLKIKI